MMIAPVASDGHPSDLPRRSGTTTSRRTADRADTRQSSRHWMVNSSSLRSACAYPIAAASTWSSTHLFWSSHRRRISSASSKVSIKWSLTLGRLRQDQSILAHVGEDRTQDSPRQALGVDRSQTAAVSSRPQPRHVIIAEQIGRPPRSLVYSTNVHPGILMSCMWTASCRWMSGAHTGHERGYAERVPAEELAELRRAAPVWWNGQPHGAEAFDAED